MSGRMGWLGCLSLALAASVCADAVAQDRPRVAVLEVEGPQARKVQGHIERGLGDHAEVVDAAGQSASSNPEFAELARNLDVQALIVTRVEKSRRFVVSVVVRQGRDGAIVGSATWAEKKPQRLSVIERALWTKLGDAIASAEGPASGASTRPASTASAASTARTAAAQTAVADEREEEEDDTTDDDEAEDEADEQVADAGDEGESEAPSSVGGAERPLLNVGLALGPMWRDQSYNDALRNAPFRYFNEVGSPAMWLGLGATFYPGALIGDGFLSQLGLVLGFGTALGLSSKDEDGNELETSATALDLGLRLRVPMDASELGFTVGYGGRSFSVEATDDTPIPEVSHSFLRLKADGSIALASALAVELYLGYLLRLGSGELEDAAYFPELSGGGIEAGLAGALAFGDSGLALRLAFDWQRFFFSMNPTLDAERVVGGALDSYYTVTLGARYTLSAN